MNHSIQDIAANLQAMRKKKGISQRTLSAKIGIPQSHISKIEKGLVDLQTSTLIQIARVLDLELVLVSRAYLSAVQALQNMDQTSKPIPAYRLGEEDEDRRQFKLFPRHGKQSKTSP